MEIRDDIKPHLKYAEAVAKLFNPFVETAVHDLVTGRVVAIYNNISKRNIGDISPIEELHIPVEKFPDVFEPYYKTNWDGKKLKCISITIRDTNNKPVGLVCFNIDTSFFKSIQLNLDTFLSVSKEAVNPMEIFESNWQEKIDEYIKGYLQNNGVALNNLQRKDKKAIIQEIYIHGIFNYKNAASYVATQLGLSRASVYNYLKG